MSNISRIQTSLCLECGSETARMGGGFVNRVPTYGVVVEGYYCGGCQSSDELKQLWYTFQVTPAHTEFVHIATGENWFWDLPSFGAELNGRAKRAIHASLNEWIDQDNLLEDHPDVEIEYDWDTEQIMLDERVKQAEQDWPFAKQFRELYMAFKEVEDKSGDLSRNSSELVELAKFVEDNNLGEVTY